MQEDPTKHGKFNSEHSLSTYCVLSVVLEARMPRETDHNSCPLGPSLGRGKFTALCLSTGAMLIKPEEVGLGAIRN